MMEIETEINRATQRVANAVPNAWKVDLDWFVKADDALKKAALTEHAIMRVTADRLLLAKRALQEAAPEQYAALAGALAQSLGTLALRGEREEYAALEGNLADSKLIGVREAAPGEFAAWAGAWNNLLTARSALQRAAPAEYEKWLFAYLAVMQWPTMLQKFVPDQLELWAAATTRFRVPTPY